MGPVFDEGLGLNSIKDLKSKLLNLEQFSEFQMDRHFNEDQFLA